MAVYKVPRLIQFVDALPKSGSGKVMWRALQEAEAAK
jgi:fatty-acyl-CoA synthase